MKTILIVYPDEYQLDTRKNRRQAHYDVHVIQFFDRLRAEKHENLYFLKTDRRKLHESVMERFGLKRFDMIITYPAFPEIEYYAEERGIQYFAFDYFSQGSTYLDRFWLFNSHTIEDFENVVGKSHLLPGTLSPLANEASYYGRYSPLFDKIAKIFYQKDKKILLCLINESFQIKGANNLIVQLKAALYDNSILFDDKANLVLFGRSRKLLARLSVSLRGAKTIGVNVIHDNLRRDENSVYSMIHKSDLIFSCRSGKGLDAIVLKKPVIFIEGKNIFFKRLNNLVTGPQNRSDLHRIGQRQHEYLRSFVSFLERKSLFFPNVSCDSNEFHKRLSKIGFGPKNMEDPVDEIHSNVSSENQSEKAIVAEYVDSTLKIKRIIVAFQQRKKLEQKHFTKFLNDPKAFFRDSKNPLFRLIGSYL